MLLEFSSYNVYNVNNVYNVYNVKVEFLSFLSDYHKFLRGVFTAFEILCADLLLSGKILTAVLVVSTWLGHRAFNTENLK